MKCKIKIFAILIFFYISIITLSNSVDAATINMELSSEQNEIEVEKISNIEVRINLLDFDRISENIVLGCYAEIEYNRDLLELVNIEGQNNWSAEFNDITNKLVLDTDSAKANTTIAIMKFKINEEEITRNENTAIYLKNMILTDGNFEINAELQTNIKIVASKKYQDDVQVLREVYTESGEMLVNNKLNALDETALKDKILPFVGNGIWILTAIVILIILTVIFKIKSRKIKY